MKKRVTQNALEYMLGENTDRIYGTFATIHKLHDFSTQTLDNTGIDLFIIHRIQNVIVNI